MGCCCFGSLSYKERRIPDDSHSRFKLGRTVITANAQNTLHSEDVYACLCRHQSGDWGDVCKEDNQANEGALKHGGRLLSVYHDRQGTKFWIITEADRSVTTILLPEDY